MSVRKAIRALSEILDHILRASSVVDGDAFGKIEVNLEGD